MDSMELEGRPPRHPLMLKEWLELEYSADLSRDGGFGCYPRHLATEPPTRSAGCRRRVNGDVIARVSAAVRAALALALSRPPSASAPARQGEAAAPALRRSLSTRLRVVGFWKKRTGDMDRPVATSCSETAARSGRRDGASSPATSPRRTGRESESRQANADRVGLSGGRRSQVEGRECEATCHLDEEREQRLSPVSVMDFQSQEDGDDDDCNAEDGDDDDCNDSAGCCDGHSDDEGTSPTFERSLVNIRRASQQLLDRIRRFEQLAELDASDVDDDATTADDDTSCRRRVGELSSTGDDEYAERGPVHQRLQGLPEASCSPCPAHFFKKLLEDFFREGMSSCHAGGSDGSDLEVSLLETAKAWLDLDGRHYCAPRSDQKAEVEEIERLGRWRCFREDEHQLLSSEVEGGIFCYLMEELVEELC